LSAQAPLSAGARATSRCSVQVRQVLRAMAMMVHRTLLLVMAIAIDVSLAWSPQPKSFFIPLPSPSTKTQRSLYPPHGPVTVLSDAEVRIMNNSKGPHAGHAVVVAMYAAWCPHCWHLVPEWVKFAQAYEGSTELEVAAVNCADEANRKLCEDAGVTAYPFIQCYGCPVTDLCRRNGCKVTVGFPDVKQGQSIPTWLNDWVKRATGKMQHGAIKPTHPEALKSVELGDHKVVLQGQPGKPGFIPSDFTPTLQRAEDAMRGFLTALWSAGSGEGSREKALKAVDFVSDLFLEQCCKVGGLPNAYRQSVILSLPALKQSLSVADANTRDVVALYAAQYGIHDLGSQDKFATWDAKTMKLSTEGEDSFKTCTTFTCSLWQFLHVTTAASAYFAAAGSPRFSPGKVMDFTRFFVDTYMTCEQCRHHFVRTFDDCEFGRCKLNKKKDWSGLVLWMWRVHEGVSLRTAAKVNAPVDRRWPSYQECPGCWLPLSFGKRSKTNDFAMKNIGKHPHLLDSPFNLTKTYNFMVAQYVGWDVLDILSGGQTMRKWEVEQLLLPPRSNTFMWAFCVVAVAGITASFSLWFRAKSGSQQRRDQSEQDMELETADACE